MILMTSHAKPQIMIQLSSNDSLLGAPHLEGYLSGNILRDLQG